MRVHTCLKGQIISYTLRRSKRKSIGLRIDHRGLSIHIPHQLANADVENVLQEKADWIRQKLRQWGNKKSLELGWKFDASFPLLGEPWQIALNASGQIVMVPQQSAKIVTQHLPQLDSQQIETFVMAWYGEQAMICFRERIGIYAQALKVSIPPFRLSKAKTRWGSCNHRGVISLNWRLIQLPLHLIDYVVVHELAHLLEMNHSKAFWQKVESVYKDYQAAREQLREYS